MPPLTHPSATRVPWLWVTAFLALWLVAAALLCQPFCLLPGRFLYASDALFLTASAFTSSGLSPVVPGARFTGTGLAILALMTQAGMAATLYVSGRLALRLFPAFTPQRQAIHPAVFRSGMRVILCAQAVLTLALWFSFRSLPPAAFDALSAAGATGIFLSDSLSQGVQFTLTGQALILPVLVLAGLGAVPVGDAWRCITSLGDHALHPVSRRIWVSVAFTFILATLLITAVLLAPHSYQLLHLGMESGASDMGPLNTRVVQDSFATATYAAGPGRLGASQPIDAARAVPGYQFLLIAFSMVGLAPLSLAGGLSALAAGDLLKSGLALWRKSSSAIAEPPSLVTRWALAMLAFYAALIIPAFFILLVSEPYPPMTLAAEVVSAASNAGFSLGITADMTTLGKAVLTALMVLGRVGPLFLAVNLIVHKPAQTR